MSRSSQSRPGHSDFDVITGPPSLPSRLPSPAGGPLPVERIAEPSPRRPHNPHPRGPEVEPKQ